MTGGPPPGAVDLGAGRYAVKVFGPDRMWCGIHAWHRTPGGAWCAGFVGFSLIPHREGIGTWRVDRFDPLTLHPSIGCRACGVHGWIRDGRWEEDA